MYRNSNKHDVAEKLQYKMLHDPDRYNSPWCGWWPCAGCDTVKPTPCGLCRRCKRYWTDIGGKKKKEKTIRQYYEYKTVHLLEEDYHYY